MDKLNVPLGTFVKPCYCKTVKDYVSWNYKNYFQNDTFINDNQTTIGKNYSAWQMETMNKQDIPLKILSIYLVNGDTGYSFSYSSAMDTAYAKNLNIFKEFLQTISLSPLEPEKKPSFLSPTDVNKSPLFNMTT